MITCAAPSGPPPVTSDALSDPSAELLRDQIAALLPQGAAWGTPDGAALDPDSRLARFWRALAAPLADLYVGLYRAALESTPATMTASLIDWEVELGLPDPCRTDRGDLAARIAAVRERFRGQPIATRADLYCLALSLGYTADAFEYQPFRCGQSRVGAGINATRLLDDSVVFKFLVRIEPLAAATFFRVGVSRCGVDRLSAFKSAEDFECIVRRAVEAELTPVFRYTAFARRRATVDGALRVTIDGTARRTAEPVAGA